jgi:chromosomal replication initiation ATPase DnaA
MPVQILLYNNLPISMTPPSHVGLKVSTRAARGDTATNVTKPATGNRAEILRSSFRWATLKIDTRTGEYIGEGFNVNVRQLPACLAAIDSATSWQLVVTAN